MARLTRSWPVSCAAGIALQPGEEGRASAGAPVARRRAEIADPVVIIVHAERGRVGRILAQQPLVMFVQQPVEILGRRGGGGCGEGEGQSDE